MNEPTCKCGQPADEHLGRGKYCETCADSHRDCGEDVCDDGEEE